MTKVKEKSKELIKSVTIYRLGGFSILFLTSNLAEIGASNYGKFKLTCMKKQVGIDAIVPVLFLQYLIGLHY